MPSRDQITSSPLPPTAVPINSHLQNRGSSETDPDGPAATVTRGALSPPLASPRLRLLLAASGTKKRQITWVREFHPRAPMTASLAGKSLYRPRCQGRLRLALTDLEKEAQRQLGSPLILCSQPWLPLRITQGHLLYNPHPRLCSWFALLLLLLLLLLF